MESSAAMPRMALVVNLGEQLTNEADAARARHLVHLFDCQRLPATWVVSEPEQARMIGTRRSALPAREIALSINDHWSASTLSSQRFQGELRRRLSELAELVGEQVTVAVGDLRRLRARASILAGQGVGAILASGADGSAPRPLACGLWSLHASVELPAARRLWGLLPASRSSVRQIVRGESGPTLIVIHAAELGRRRAYGAHALDKLLRDVAWAGSRKELDVVTAGQIVAELVGQNQVKPQRSILRVAA